MHNRVEAAGLCLLLFMTLFFSSAEADPVYTDAELLALEISGELLPPPDVVAQIGADLAAVRDWDAYFEGIHARPEWVPGEILVRLTAHAWQEYEMGEYHGLDSLNAFYGPVEIDSIPSLHLLILTFTQVYNPEVLVSIYREADGVAYAEPNFVGGDGNDIRCTEIGRYTFRRGWGDCPAGCMYQHIWLFLVEDGLATLLDDYGDPPPDQPTGACCDSEGTCVVTTHWDCQGNWQGAGVPCNPNPCTGTLIERQSWGTIKARFRAASR